MCAGRLAGRTVLACRIFGKRLFPFFRMVTISKKAREPAGRPMMRRMDASAARAGEKGGLPNGRSDRKTGD